MPYIGRVLRAVAPYMDHMIVTSSIHSDQETIDEIQKVAAEFPGKMFIAQEDVSDPSELTQVRQDQVDRTYTDWFLVLDDDNLWLPEQLELCLAELDKDPEVMAFSVEVRQVIDENHHDSSWHKKSFSDFIRNKDIEWQGNWPKDLAHDKDGALYHKTHPYVKRLPYWHYHLSYVKDWTFRKDGWANEFRQNVGTAVKLEKPIRL